MSNRVKLGLIAALAILAVSLLISNGTGPDNALLFGLKRAQENMFLGLKGGVYSKLEYQNVLLDKRLDELTKLATKEKSYFLWSASLRYTSTAGKIAEQIKANNLTDQAKTQIEIFKNDQQAIRQALDQFPRDFANEDWKFLEDAINYLDLYIKQLSSN